MKLVTYLDSGQARLGAVVGERVIGLRRASDGALPDDMLQFLQLGDAGLQAARESIANQDDAVDLAGVELLAPIPKPGKVIAIGLNYLDHVRESGIPMPQLATMFCKFPSAVIGNNSEIRWSEKLTRQVDYEAELAVVIGQSARNLSEANAMQTVAGYMNCNDVSARDLQFRPGDQWLRGKCLDSFCPLGPWLVTRDEIPDPHRLGIQCRVNGEVRQDSNTAEMIYRLPYLLQYLSEAFTLEPGDVIATGTPHGVGAFRDPPVWLQSGDLVEVEIEGLGCLRNRCRIEP